MPLETANIKWLEKAEKLCKSREFEHEFDKEEFRGKDFSENKYPYIEGKLCMSVKLESCNDEVEFGVGIWLYGHRVRIKIA